MFHPFFATHSLSSIISHPLCSIHAGEAEIWGDDIPDALNRLVERSSCLVRGRQQRPRARHIWITRRLWILWHWILFWGNHHCFYLHRCHHSRRILRCHHLCCHHLQSHRLCCHHFHNHHYFLRQTGLLCDLVCLLLRQG